MDCGCRCQGRLHHAWQSLMGLNEPTLPATSHGGRLEQPRDHDFDNRRHRARDLPHFDAQQSAHMPATISSGLEPPCFRKLSDEAGRPGLCGCKFICWKPHQISSGGGSRSSLSRMLGIGDLNAIYLTIGAGSAQETANHRFGGWRLAANIVLRLASAMKCRGTDDLHVVSEVCPQWNDDRRNTFMGAKLTFRSNDRKSSWKRTNRLSLSRISHAPAFDRGTIPRRSPRCAG